jgi:hypothetical protein
VTTGHEKAGERPDDQAEQDSIGASYRGCPDRESGFSTPTGSVLVTGGRGYASLLGSVECLQPGYDAFCDVGSTKARIYATETSLPSGDVLLVGGQDSEGRSLASADLLS